LEEVEKRRPARHKEKEQYLTRGGCRNVGVREIAAFTTQIVVLSDGKIQIRERGANEKGDPEKISVHNARERQKLKTKPIPNNKSIIQ